MKLDPTSNSAQPSKRATVINGQQTIVSSGHDKAVPKTDVVANQSPTKIGISSVNAQSTAIAPFDGDNQKQQQDPQKGQSAPSSEILQATALSKKDQKALLNKLPGDVASQLKRLANQLGQVQLFQVKVNTPDGPKTFISPTQYSIGDEIQLKQKASSQNKENTGTSLTATQGKPAPQNPTKVESWQSQPAPPKQFNAQSLINAIKQYQPLKTNHTNVPLNGLKTLSENTHLPIDSAKQIKPVLQQAPTQSGKSAQNEPRLTSPSPPKTLPTSSSHSLEPRNTKINYAKQDWLVAIKQSMSDSIKPPSNPSGRNNNISPASLTNEPTNRSSAMVPTTKPATIDPSIQASEIKGQQWAQVQKVTPLDASSVKNLLPRLPESLQRQLKSDGTPQLYQIQLQTSIGNMTLVSPVAYDKGQQIQISLSTDNNILQQWIAQKPPQQHSLLNALRQYQPLQTAFNSIAVKHLEASHMQQLATQVKAELIAQPRNEQGPSVNNPVFSHIKQLKSQAQQLLQELKPSVTQAPLKSSNAPINTQTISPSGDSTTSTAISKQLIQPGQILTAQQIKLALSNAGQEFEAKLLASAQALKSNQGHSEPQRLSTQDKIDVQRGFSHIQQHLQAGIKDWVRELTGRFTSNELNPSSVSANQASDQSEQPKMVAPTHQQDLKGWLIQHQLLLMQGIQSNPSSQPDQKQLMDGLLRLLFPSTPPKRQQPGEPLLPKNLSIQPQLQKLFSQMLNQADDSDSTQTQSLRSLLNLTQSLTRIQQEQVFNRHQQTQQPDTPDFQLSLPYLQEKNIHWCELECRQHSSTTKNSQHKQGWHLILRFAQATENRFAIEASLATHQLSITLWSENQQRLQQLHRHGELFRRKLQHAGFECDEIHSKRGMPAKKQRHINQGLVDIHT